MLSLSDVFRRSTETIPEPMDFAAGSGGGRFESSFQTLGCLVSRHGRLFVKSLDCERPQGDRDNFPDKTNVEWFERFDGASFCCGKNDPVLGECVYTKHRRTGTADTTLRNGDSHRRQSQSLFSRSRRKLGESDVDVGISQVISMLGNRSVVQEKSLRDWPRTGQLASRLASPMSFIH